MNHATQSRCVRHWWVATCLWLVTLMGASVRCSAQELRPAVGFWSFDADLRDRSGLGNDAFAHSAAFVPGLSDRGLQCRAGGGGAVVPDCPELRPAPGLRIECRARLDALGTSWQPLVLKEGAYQLRIDPPREGGCFSFFVHLGDWEPRIRSETVARVGVWYRLAAGWDGREIWIEVDGRGTRRARPGTPGPSRDPIELGLFDGVLDEVRIENPGARFGGVARWQFEGDLRDASGGGHHLVGTNPRFVPAAIGRALMCGPGQVQAASAPELQLAPGLRFDCAVCLDRVPPDGAPVVFKEGEYQLRVNPSKEGGGFALFVKLDGWEPRVDSDLRTVAGRWYRVAAGWDGAALTLDVNGQRTRQTRWGIARPTSNPVLVGAPGMRIAGLEIENPRLPTLQVGDTRQQHAILCAGRVERFTTPIRNAGAPAERVAVRLAFPPGVRCLPGPVHELGAMSTGAERTIEWTVESDAPIVAAAGIHVTADRTPPVSAHHPLVFFPGEDGPAIPDGAIPGAGGAGATGAVTYYVDAVRGRNANSGMSPDAPWADFSNVNGRTLGPGDRLLIRRGSVFGQELTLSARGTREHWAEIGTYGTGPRPILRRDWDIGDRCVLVRDPDFLRVRGLVVSHAAKGLIVTYSGPGHRGLWIEDCIAHHIEGLYRHNSHGIPEWRDRAGPGGDGINHSAGIAVAGASAAEIVLRDCEMYQTSAGFFVLGDDVLIERVHCHDNYVHNTSPHPFLVEVRRALLCDSIFDAAGWHASAGTMGIMLGNPQGLIIRNCIFRNQPDSGSHDEGGIDFENRGTGCLIDRCTFENNAGAAIEVLGLKSPQTTNIEIRHSRFIGNNTARKLGPSEIFVWGRVRDPSICRSTGLICGNGYVTRPGVEFFVNEAAALTQWTLHDNTAYDTVEAIERAMPFNRPPTVDAGAAIRSDRTSVQLSAKATDDGKPAGGELSTLWEMLEGPGPVTFDDPAKPDAIAAFGARGDYMLRFVARDGEFRLSDTLVVHMLPAGTTVVAAWEFNSNLDKLGWSERSLGTRIQHWPDPRWPTTSHPVHHVTGGYYVVAAEQSTDAHLLSPDRLGLDLSGREDVILRFQNHTPARKMRLRFTTDTDDAWDDARSRDFAVTPDDTRCRTYAVPMSTVPAWKGRLRQLRIDLATGTPLSGTCRFDYVWIAVRPDAAAARR